MSMTINVRNGKVIIRYLLVVLLVISLSAQFSPPPVAAQVVQGDIPDFFHDFIIFYSSGKLAKMPDYVHPDRGLIQNNYLLTYEEVKEDFKALSSDYGKIESIKVIVDYGLFLSEEYYRAECRVKYRVANYTQLVPTIFVFEKIDGTWYLVQSEMVEFMDQFHSRGLLTVGYILPDIETATNTGRLYKSSDAAKKGKATLLYFFSLMDIYGENNSSFFYEIFNQYGNRDDIYIFGVSDDDKANVESWMKDTGKNFVWLVDEESLLHYDLWILIHPMILLLDKEGRLVMMSSWRYEDREKLIDLDYRTESQALILQRIAEVLEKPVENPVGSTS